jgi:hypothetical protein
MNPLNDIRARLNVSPMLHYGEHCQDVSWLLARGDELAAALQFYVRHYVCEDCWYSCPKSEDYCGTADRTQCDCGADKANAALAAWREE